MQLNLQACEVIQEQFKLVNKACLHYFLFDLQLERHMDLIFSFVLMAQGERLFQPSGSNFRVLHGLVLTQVVHLHHQAQSKPKDDQFCL